jgi:hypothetical protein
MAIDQDIAQRVDAYRGNPQALQQRYAANQELLDLLALQRLKSEKDDAMRKVQMEMQQDPQTIKQQKERQLLDMTKQDLTNQTAGIMQNAQKKQQKNMQRVAKQGAANPQQMQKMQAGLGALAQRQQNQAPMRMAQGGIVAFKQGGITQADIDEYRRNKNKMLGNFANMNRLTDGDIRKILEGLQDNKSGAFADPSATPLKGSSPKTVEFSNDPNNFRQAPILDAEGALESPSSGGSGKTTTDTIVPPQRPPKPPAEAPAKAEAPAEAEAEGVGEAGLKTLTAPVIDMTKADSLNSGISILEKAGLGEPQTPDASKNTARDSAATFLGRDAKRTKMDSYLDELKQLDVRQQDPEKLRRERLQAFKLGAAGRGSTTLAGAGAAAFNQGRFQERDARDRVLKRIDIDKEAMQMDTDIGKSAQSSGDTAYEQSMANRRSIADVLSKQRSGDLEVAIADAKMALETNQNNIANELKRIELKYTNAIRKDLNKIEQRSQAQDMLRQFNNDRNALINAELGQNPTYLNADSILKNPQASEDQKNQAEQIIITLTNAATFKVNALYDQQGLNDLEQSLMDDIGIGTGSGSSISNPTIDTLVEKYSK